MGSSHTTTNDSSSQCYCAKEPRGEAGRKPKALLWKINLS